MTKAQLQKEALKLPPEERAELLESLHMSLLESPLPEWQQEVLDERLDEYERDPNNTLSWPEVKASLDHE